MLTLFYRSSNSNHWKGTKCSHLKASYLLFLRMCLLHHQTCIYLVFTICHGTGMFLCHKWIKLWKVIVVPDHSLRLLLTMCFRNNTVSKSCAVWERVVQLHFFYRGHRKCVQTCSSSSLFLRRKQKKKKMHQGFQKDFHFLMPPKGKTIDFAPRIDLTAYWLK